MSGGSGLSGDAVTGIKGYHQLKNNAGWKAGHSGSDFDRNLALLGQVIYWPR